MDTIRTELERVYQLCVSDAEARVRADLQAQRRDLEDREAALAAAMELASVDPAVRAAFHDGILEERRRWLALVDSRLACFDTRTTAFAVLDALRKAGEGGDD